MDSDLPGPGPLHRTLQSLKGLLRDVLRALDKKAIAVADFVLVGALSAGRSDDEVLVVRLDAIGDFILWLDAANELRKLFPGKKLVLFGNAIWAELASRIGHWDEVYPVDIAKLERLSRYRYRLLAAVRRRGFALAVQPTFSRVRLTGDALIRASGAPERIGSAGDLSNMDAQERVVADSWYTRLLAASDHPLMEIERNAEFVRQLGDPAFAASLPHLPTLGLLPESLRFDTPYRVVVPGASAAIRRWPADRFAAIVNELQNQSSFTTVLSGSQSERALCDSVAAMIDGPVINLAGRTALWELVEIIRDAELLIGNDTSTAHIAAAVRTPTICILGGGHYGRFMPYGDLADDRYAPREVTHKMNCFNCNWRCTQPHRRGGPVPCISSISVADVRHATDRALSA